MSIVLAVAEGEVFVNDADIQKSALQVAINCVCAPDKRMSSIGKFIAGTPRRRLPQQTKASESVLTKMWNVVQSNNGIKVWGGRGSESLCFLGFSGRFILGEPGAMKVKRHFWLLKVKMTADTINQSFKNGQSSLRQYSHTFQLDTLQDISGSMSLRPAV